MKILFISHDASRTGAPLVVLNFARWIKKQEPQVQFDFLLLRGGELEQEFATLGTVFREKTAELPVDFFSRLRRFFFGAPVEKTVLDQLAGAQYDVIYANTVVTLPAATTLQQRMSRKPRLIVHVHEMRSVIALLCPDFASLAPKADVFIAVARAVENDLMQVYNIPADKIRRVSEFMMEEDIRRRLAARGSSRKEMAGKFVIGGSGNVHWRKGPDLFLQVAVSIFKKRPSFPGLFLWVGMLSREEQIICDEDIRKAGLAGKVVFAGAQSDPYPWYDCFDVFLMTSREDPFPLVALEAGAMGKPIVCFRGAGGTEEMIATSGGVVVPYLDTEAMADAVLHHYDQPGEHGRASDNFRQYDISEVAPRLMQVIHEAR